MSKGSNPIKGLIKKDVEPLQGDETVEAGELLPVGKIAGVHGIKGDVKIFPFEGMEWLDSAALKGVAPFFLMDPSGKLAEGKAIKLIRRQKGIFIASLEGCDRREDAAALTGRLVCVRKKDLPALPEGEYYLTELEGMDVWADDDRHLGRVINVFPTGANDVIEVKGRFGTILIPAVAGVVKEVNLAARKMTVHLMEGLIESGAGEKA